MEREAAPTEAFPKVSRIRSRKGRIVDREGVGVRMFVCGVSRPGGAMSRRPPFSPAITRTA